MNLFIKYFTKTISEDEKNILFDKVESDANLKEEFFKAQMVWALLGVIDDKSENNNSMKRSTFTVSRRLYVAAAILLLAGLVSLILFNLPNKNLPIAKEFVTISTENGKQLKHTLPDGSIVWLNGATKLIYPKKFANCREVNLEGEAYFEVAKDKKHPFRINSGAIKISVLGTGFNVHAYAADKYIITTLVHGNIILETSAKFKGGVNKISMSPGQQLETFNTNGKIVKEQVNSCLYISWINGIYRFKEENFEQIALMLGRNFNLNIHFNDEELKLNRYTGAFKKTDDALKILRFINLSTPICYSKNGNDIYISKKH